MKMTTGSPIGADATRLGDVTITTHTGDRLAAVLADVSRLRIAVFRDWPYLYDGTLADERVYLETFARATDAVIVVARDRDHIVGAATAAPILQHTPKFAALFERAGYDPSAVFYCGEGVLDRSCRGRGIGHAFFDHREAHARRSTGPLGPYTHSAFCGVVRSDTHPARPADYAPLDAFWHKRGYRRIDGLIGAYAWRDVGEATETEKSMQFWVRAL